MSDKPTFHEYLAECATALGFPGDLSSAESTYTINLRAALQSIMDGAPLAGIVSTLKEIPQRYAIGRPDLLFYPPSLREDLPLLMKPFKSSILKIYRQNVLFNKNYPEAPRYGFLDPLDMYEQIDDLIRARLVCKYMDGPKYVCHELKKYCSNVGIECKYRNLDTEAGYYAWHFYFQCPVQILSGAAVRASAMWVEIQLSTQLAEVITSLTHGLYEARREGSADEKRGEWKWDANSQRFRSAYLGHGLHLLEGIIQKFRDDMLGAAGVETASDIEAVKADAESPSQSDHEETSSGEDKY